MIIKQLTTEQAERLDALQAEAGPCSCGHPERLGVVHLAAAPCYTVEPTDEQRAELYAAQDALLNVLAAYNDPLSIALSRFVHAFKGAVDVRHDAQ